eukprot:jgi/Chrzof1/10273/Cz04g35070.t1
MVFNWERGQETFLNWVEQHGSYVYIQVLHKRIVLVMDPVGIQQILCKGSSYCARKTPEYTNLDVAHGFHGYTAMLTHQDEEIWKVARKAVAPAYTLANVRKQFPLIVKSLQAAALHIMDQIDAGDPEVSVDEEIFIATVNIIAEGFLLLNPEAIKVDPKQMVHDLETITSIAYKFITAPWNKILYTRLPWLTQESRTMHAARMRMNTVMSSVYDYIYKIKGPNPDDADLSLPACYMRLTHPHIGQRYCKEAVMAEITNTFMASETVPCTVSWALYCIATHPEVEARLLQELSAVGVPCNSSDLDAICDSLNCDVLKQLPYLDNVIAESMRMYPAGGPASPRVVEAPTMVGPYKLPAGVVVFPCLHTVMNYSGNWEDPQTFNPDRWLNDNAAVHPATGAPRFMPFSLGPKSCAGQHLALLETKTALAMMIACFNFKLAPCMGGLKGLIVKVQLPQRTAQ